MILEALDLLSPWLGTQFIVLGYERTLHNQRSTFRIYLKEIGWGDVDLIDLAEDRDE
jgi:hypothetical protein